MVPLLLILSCVRPWPAPAPASGALDLVFTDPEGQRGRARVVVPDSAPEGKPLGVLFFFTWDGGAADYAEQAALHAPLAEAHGLVMVSMPPPESQSCWWAPRVEDNVRFVQSFLDKNLIEELGVDPARVFLTGLSGGADFAAAFGYHTGFRYGGGSVALCGGDLPRLNGGRCRPERDPPAAPALEHAEDRPPLRYDFALTADDPLLPKAQDAMAFYAAAGFSELRLRVVPGQGHCGFAEGFEGLETLAQGLDYVDPR